MKGILVILGLMMFLAPVSVFGISWCNGSPGAYAAGNNTLENLTIKGAGQFLKGNADFLLFLQRYELNQTDIPGMIDALKGAIENVQGLTLTYSELKSLAEQTPYNQEVLTKLANFDYTGYQPVKSFLSVGNVTGAYSEVVLKSQDILTRLYTIQQDLEKGISPDVTVLWGINQRFIDLMLFGQNVAQVFKTIK